MTVAASQVFSFLEECPTCTIEKHEICSAAFSELRRSVRGIVARLNEDADEEAREISERLRSRLSEWLTAPVSFDDSLLEPISSLGDTHAVERRCGDEVRTAYEIASAAARLLRCADNPVRVRVRDVVLQLRRLGSSWKIYCHRRARTHFESMFPDDPLPADLFLHSVKDYRESEPFGSLIKVGALRSSGWGSLPDAVISAPRFGKMIQIVWSGCRDEDDFGYDPVGIVGSTGPTGAADHGGTLGTRWKRTVLTVGEAADVAAAKADDDELKFFRTLGRTTPVRRATLVLRHS